MQATAPELKLARLSRARYDAMIAAGILTENDAVELLDGQLYEAMPKGKKHNACINRASKLLEGKLGHRCIISVQNSIALHEYSEPEPDIAVLRSCEDFYEAALPGPRDVLFLIEVSDATLAYDRDLKIPLYAAADIPEVWLVDVQARTVTVYREPEGNHYRQETIYRCGDVMALSAFPGENIVVADLGL
ncbi:MAG: Uma2 family endonuclease [Roseimicrobium sp.]